MIIFMKYSYLLITLIIAITSNNVLAQKKCPEYDDWNNGCYGKYTNDDGSILEGQWHNNYLDGQGTYYIRSKDEWEGSKYVGEFKNGLYHGQGTFTYGWKSEWASDKYVGEYKEGERHGQGTYYFGPKRKSKEYVGDKYSGAWKNDKRHGLGTYSYADGDKYVGEYKEGERHGHGTFTFADGENYVGEFKNGLYHGQGTFTFADGENYVGAWKNDKYHGHGTFTFASGDKYVGAWKNDKEHGQGTYTWIDGSKYTGNFIDGDFNGYGKLVYNDGYVEEGNWVDGILSTYSKSIEENKVENNNKNSYTDNSKVFPAASGTAFSISKDGYLITNDHVISDCVRLTAHNDNLKSEAKVILNDPLNDVALLKTDLSRLTALPFSINKAALMQEIYVAGFPFGDYYSSSVKVTKGIVSALSGMGNNFSNFQIDAALQPGNSGGPVIDEKGNLIGVAVAKLDQSATFDDFGTLPENTNFAIKTGVIKNILDAAKIKPRQANKKNLSRDKLATLIVDSTFHITCFMTESQIKEIQSQAKKDKVLFKNIKF
jgi:hypothetical protein